MTETEFSLISRYIEEVCGIHLEPEKTYLIETRLTQLVALAGCDDFVQFHDHVRRSKDPLLPDKIIDAITTNETFWFRDIHPFAILREVVLPEIAMRLRTGGISRARLWSAAASTGQEAYSMGISIHEFCRENPGVKPEQFEIVATDISPAALSIAKGGRYDAITLSRGMPDHLRERYFRQDGRVWQLIPEVAKMVRFQRFNLSDSLLLLGRFDVIFMRYVLIYFSAELKKRILESAASALTERGVFIIGGTESIRGFSDAFSQEFHAGGAYYRRQKR